jgi:UDP-N-acetylmuramoyl-L-alanyl-D-glutamate--2,6-diaminopimelate ligase
VKLQALLRDINILDVAGDAGGTVADICYDSRKCGKDSLFVAIDGLTSDGHDFIADAADNGARYIVHDKEVSQRAGLTYIKVRNSRRALGRLGRNFYHNPTSELCLVGVTGTNGKTTVTYLLEAILGAAGYRAGVVGTVNYRYNGTIVPSTITTPESVDLQKIFRDMAASGVTHVVMEVSSHALDLERVDECEFDIGIFTNLSQDHLDYHHTLENYFVAKKRFFLEILKEGRGMIVNSDDPWGSKLLDGSGRRAVSFAIERAGDISVTSFELSTGGIRAEVLTGDGSFPVSSSLIGKFNLYNILAAVAAALALGIPEEAIRRGIETLGTVPGRLEKVSGTGEPAVFVDYAHTDDALKNVLLNLSEFKTHRIITVFGCGGDRDRGKRPLMGHVAARLSDLAIVTSDNPRTENPLEIISEIEEGIAPVSLRKYRREELSHDIAERGYVVMPDRKEAITKAILIADPSDIVLIAGKGHEDYQIIGTTRISFDDSVVARDALRKRALGERQ